MNNIRFWPDLKVKLALIREKYGVELFPSQRAASSVLTGERRAQKLVQVIGGERAGKSAWAGVETAALLPWCDLVFLAGMKYENTEAEFEYVKQHLQEIGYLADVSQPKHGMWSLTMRETGAELRTLSFAQDGIDALPVTGKAPDLIVLCEAGMLDEGFLTSAYLRVAEKRGGVIATGTLKRSRPWYVSLYNRMQQGGETFNGRSFSFPSWENEIIYPGGESDPAILAMKAVLSETEYQERLGAVPVPSSLLVFGREFDWKLHVKRQDYDAGLPLWLACDPGYAGAYSLLVVQAASSSEVRVIDEFYGRYKTWDDAVNWLLHRPYVRVDGRGWIKAPSITRAVMDVAGRQHHGDKSQVEQWYDATGLNWRGQTVPIETGINRMRDFLRSPFDWGTPRLLIDPKCEGLLFELSEGEVYQKDRSGEPLREAPIDRHNHSRKALSYLLVDAFGESEGGREAVSTPGRNPYRRTRRAVSAETVLDMVDGTIRFTNLRSDDKIKTPLRFR